VEGFSLGQLSKGFEGQKDRTEEEGVYYIEGHSRQSTNFTEGYELERGDHRKSFSNKGGERPKRSDFCLRGPLHSTKKKNGPQWGGGRKDIISSSGGTFRRGQSPHQRAEGHGGNSFVLLDREKVPMRRELKEY